MIDTPTLWKRLVEFQLLDESVCAGLQDQYASQDIEDKLLPETLANWLSEQKVVSTYQIDILRSETPGDLKFGNYHVISPLDPESKTPNFLARHWLTRHPVVLRFVGGSDSKALAHWREVKKQAQLWQQFNSPVLQTCFETEKYPY